MDNNFGVLADTEKERKPLLEVCKEKSEVTERSGSKGKQRKKIIDDHDKNTPASLDVKKIKHRGAEGLQQIKTCPPSPQCFSDAPNRKPFKTKALNQERIILQELKLANREPTGSNGRRRTTTTEVVERLWQSLWMFSGS